MAEQDGGMSEAGGTREVSRRRALAKLGLTAAAVYIAPSVLRINRNARAQFGGSTPCPPPDNNPLNNPPSCPA